MRSEYDVVIIGAGPIGGYWQGVLMNLVIVFFSSRSMMKLAGLSSVQD